MPTIKISFPGGRYHATPWGHHVNEGQLEWPPSPWRLLRALIAVGYTKLHWETLPDAARTLIETLAENSPEYLLPSASSAHSRHYMPIGKLNNSKLEGTTLVFDTWANVGDSELIVHWDCQLNDECRDLFKQLVANLGYLGRSESWVEAELLDEPLDLVGEASVFRQRAFPCEGREYPGPDWEQVQLMAAIPPAAFAQWRTEQTEPLLAEHSLPEGSKPSSALLTKRSKAVAAFPEDLIECLQKDTSWWKNTHKWSQPPGSQRVLYWRHNEALMVSQPQRPRRPDPHPVQCMLLALSTANRNSAALPPVTRTLPQAELFHRAIVARAGKGKRIRCSELTGKDSDGNPLKHHEHAHLLPLDLDQNGHLDHLLVWAPMGLSGIAQTAIRLLKSTWTKKGDDLQVALVGRGDLKDLRRLPDSLAGAIEQLLGPQQGATHWISATPYVAPRHCKRNGKNTLDGQIASELKSRYGAELTSFRVIHPSDEPSAVATPDTSPTVVSEGARATRFRHYIRTRNHGGQEPPTDYGYAIAIEVAEPITGPLCLGYASHFGLGRFDAY